MAREGDRKGKRQRVSKHNENRETVKGRKMKQESEIVTKDREERGREIEMKGGRDGGRHKIIRLLPWH